MKEFYLEILQRLKQPVKKETEEVELFYDIFEKKLRELRNYVICRQCGEKVSVAAKFCPECGSKM